MPRERSRAQVRAAIVEAAADLLAEGGPTQVTTRAVAERAGVQAPTIYRLLGDKDGLLDAVAEHVLAVFVAGKAATAAQAELDPVEELRASWHRQVEFGLANPDVFRLLSDPARTTGSVAAQAGLEVLRSRVARIAAVGRLRLPGARAVELVHAAGIGVVQALLALPADRRDPTLAGTMLDAVLDAVLVDRPAPTPDDAVAAAVALHAHAADLDELTAAERRLLVEWLDRVASRPSR